MALFRRLSGFRIGLLAVVLGLGMTAPVAAQAPPSGYSANVTGITFVAPGSVKADINMVRNAQGVYTASRYSIGNETLGAFGKTALKRISGAYTAYTLVKGIVDAAGWAINELQQQVQTQPTGQPIAEGETVWCVDGSGQGGYGMPSGVRCSTTQQGIQSFIISQALPIYGTPINAGCFARQGSLLFSNYDDGGGGCGASGPVATLRTFGGGAVPVDGYQPAREVTNAELGEKIRQSLPASQAVMTDRNGKPYDHQELRDAVKQALQEYAAANGDTYTPPELPALDPNNPTRAPGTGGDDAEPPKVELPEFCEWATVVCDFIEWYKEEPVIEKPEVPEEELQLPEQGWTSGLSGDASCPAPSSVTFDYLNQGVSVEFSYGPVCDLARMLRPVIIAVFALASAFVLAGLRGARNA